MAIGRSFGGVWAASISLWAVLGIALVSLAAEPPASVVRPIAASASSSYNADMGPEKTIDGSGLDPNDGHSTLETAMWLSAADAPLPAWIQYEFDAPYALKEMWVWNSNQPMESVFGFGAKSVMVEYSTDGVKWTQGSDVEFARAPGRAAYAHNTTVDLGGVTAKYVRLTIQSNWGGLVAQCGLSEVRFFCCPPEETVVVDDFEGYTN
ncbi:MAG: discoidin domain-containing protein, partial [Sedimentisphaerales bacterium]|nr:discoidin domain-containing protein [Sedimentisphaerales bacterium]